MSPQTPVNHTSHYVGLLPLSSFPLPEPPTCCNQSTLLHVGAQLSACWDLFRDSQGVAEVSQADCHLCVLSCARHGVSVAGSAVLRYVDFVLEWRKVKATCQLQLCLDIDDTQSCHVAFITWNVKMDIVKIYKRCYKVTTENVLFFKGFILITGHLKV